MVRTVGGAKRNSTQWKLVMKMTTLWRASALPVTFVLLLASAASIFGGQARSGSTEPAPPQRATEQDHRSNGESETDRPKLQKRGWRYRLRPGDLLDLTFPLTPEFDQKATVQPDGYITLRGVGDVRAEGQTAPELTQALQTAYTKILHDPIISVDLKEFEKPYFVVGGEVGRPGKFDLRSDTTASAAIAIAGSFKETAKHSQVLLVRRVSDHWAEVKVLNLKKMLEAKDFREDPYLQPGDMLFVPKNALSKVKPFIPIPGVGFSLYPGAF